MNQSGRPGSDGSEVTSPSGLSREGSISPLGSSGPTYVRMVLLVGTPYDLFSLEEEHRLLDVLRREYSKRDLGYVPVVDLAQGLDEASEMARKTRYDLLILFRLAIGPVTTLFLDGIRKGNRSLQVAYVAPIGADMDSIIELKDGAFDHVLMWKDDVDLFPTLITLAEDLSLLGASIGRMPLRSAVIVLEPELGPFTQALITAHRAVWDLTLSNMRDDLSHEERQGRTERRPLLIGFRSLPVTRLPDWVRALCVIAPSVPEGDRALSMLDPDRSALMFCNKDTAVARSDIGAVEVFLGRVLGQEGLTVGQGPTMPPAKIEDLRTLEIFLGSVPLNVLDEIVREGTVRRWLMAMGELEVSEMLSQGVRQGPFTQETRNSLVKALRNRRYRGSGTSIMNYDRSMSGGALSFSKIGTGAMGGKARALHFIGRLLEERFPGMVHDGVRISIPRTVVITTDMFERFLVENGLTYDSIEKLPDERIVQTFLSSDLPPMLLGDLRSIIDELEGPIVIRSSSLLEDALFQPFAGIYASVMLSNSQMERDQRFQNLCTAVKYVYASTYLSRARAYIRSTRNDPSSERMSVMVQEVVGKRRGEYFYPAFSGVGRSFDYWPQGDCVASDGCVNMAIGLGKMIVDGGATYRFCPAHPRMRAMASPSDRLAASQRRFFAVRLFTRVKKTDFGEDSQMVLLDIDETEGHGILELAASTYSLENDRFYPGTGRSGPRAIDLAPILEEGAFPLPELIRTILEMGQGAIGSPVEIEFAIDMEDDVPVFHLLQMRSMVPRCGEQGVDIGRSRGKVVMECSRCLGNGTFELSDVILVRERELGEGPTSLVRKELARLDSALQAEGRGYVLIGPGRWGSCDPWLGVPVSWNDISGVKVLIEVPAQGRPIDPSQGSHFFQNITSLRLGYMTLSPEEDGKADWDALYDGSIVTEHIPLVHLRSKEGPFKVHLDGRKGRGVLVLPCSDQSDAPATVEDKLGTGVEERGKRNGR